MNTANDDLNARHSLPETLYWSGGLPWQQGRTYIRGSVVEYQGGWWECTENTSLRPGSGAGWIRRCPP